MFIVILKYSENRSQAESYLEGHIAWIKRGYDDGVFLLSGMIQPDSGGAVLAHNESLSDLQNRVNEDPFVMEGIVKSEILEITPGRTDDRLAFLKEPLINS